MDLDDEVNFTEICRCCKQTESGMSSIFIGTAHPTDPTCTYPSVKEMLSVLASLNVQENDELPSLVCTLCLSNIQDAFTFVLQLIQINEELSQMLARRKANTLPQSTYESNQYNISTDFVKKEDLEENEFAPVQAGVSENLHNSEDGNHSLSIKEEEFDEPMLNFYQQRTADCSFENINLVVKSEIVPVPEIEEVMPLQQELNKVFPGLFCDKCNKPFKTQRNFEKHKCAIGLGNLTCNICNIAFESFTFLESHRCAKYCATSTSSLADPLHLGPDEEKELELNLQKKQNYTYNKNENLTVKDNDNDLLIQTAVGIEDFEHVNDMGADEDYQVDIKDVKDEIVVLSEDESTLSAVEDCNAETDDVDDVEIEETQQPQTTTTLTMFRCKLCAYANAHLYRFKQHLQTHCKNQPFACSRCKATFMQRDIMKRHWRTCSGEPPKRHYKNKRAGAAKRVTSLTQEDLKDPLKFASEIDVLVTDQDMIVQSTTATTKNKGDDDLEIEEVLSPNWRTKRRKTTTNLFNCKMCTYICATLTTIKRHLLTHCTDRPFTCAKCNGTFQRKCNMLRHWRNCKGKIPCKGRYKGKVKKRKPMISLCQEDLKDPCKLKNYYTVTNIDEPNNDDVKVQGGKLQRVLKCKLCGFTHANIYRLRAHLKTHSGDQRFTCSKCNVRFSGRGYLFRHWRHCSGGIPDTGSREEEGEKASKQVLLLNGEDLDDPLKMQEYYTVSKIEN